jgi:mRNA-degrading endonuclease RelE of RelBE toxin-antitoxin system
MPRYQLRYSAAYLDDFRTLDAFERPKVREAVLLLADQAERPTRNRRPLKAPVSWCPEATWQLRTEDYRILYRVESGEVFVLRVRFKGQGNTEEMGS